MERLLDLLASDIVVLEAMGRNATLRPGDLVRARPRRHLVQFVGPEGRLATARLNQSSVWGGETLGQANVLLRLEEPVEDLVILRVWQFAAATTWHEPRVVAVDDEATEIARRFVSCEGPDDLIARLRYELPLGTATSTFACFTTGQAADTVSFVAPGYVVDVRLVDGLLRIHSMARPRARLDIDRLQLVFGDVDLVTSSYASEIGTLAEAEHRSSAKASRFFQTWRNYTEGEAAEARRRAADFPAVNYVDVEQDTTGDLVFQLADGHPTARLLGNLRTGARVVLEASGPRADAVHGTCRTPETDTDNVVVMHRSAGSADRFPAGRGTLRYSTLGDDISIGRRTEALTSTATHTPRRAIELLLDGVLPPTSERRRRYPPVSAAVIEIFGGPPTDAQRRALDVALNTPDFAIIQGPPGTGKTRVIAALQARLDEIHQRERAGNEERQVLLTGPQHDAVEHAATAATLGRLPAIKLGGKHGEPDPGAEQTLRWRRDLEARLLSTDTPPESRRLLDAAAQFRARHQRVTALTSPRDSLEMLRWLASEEASPFLREDLASEVARSVAVYESSVAQHIPPVDIPRIERAVRSLRCTLVAFADDGAARCRDLRELLDELDLGTDHDHVLDGLAEQPTPPDPEDLVRLRHLRERWLDLSARSQATGGVVGPEIRSLFERIVRSVEETVDSEVDPETRALDRFARRLREEPTAVHRSLLRHTSTLAATLQHTASKVVTEYQPTDEPYETVIVDEAARALPGDLLIPLSRARRRVILVGDHRQLPQHIDEQIVRGARDVDEEFIRTSLFQRLFDALAETVGPERRVTLDTQFRMHPDIGSLISETFYEPHGERLVNGVGAEERSSDDLPVSGALSWIDVPASDGPEMGRTRRPCEARVAADRLVDVLSSSPHATVGVISPYQQQVDALWEALHERNLAAHDRFGSWAADPAWVEAFDDGVCRFRIGTIDSFQGREFDVVLFSATRCSQPSRPDHRLFGFLRSPNRMNVALSRARRALIIVGDRQFFATRAQHDVPALFDLATRGDT